MTDEFALPFAISENDDAQFAVLARDIAQNLLDDLRPDLLHRVAIKGHFDRKWLGFAGKFLGAAGAWYKTSSITLPPFHPRRIGGIRTYERVSEVPLEYVQRQPAKLHRWQRSDENFQRKIAKQEGPSAVYVWRSIVTRDSPASLMVYTRAGGRNNAWFATFRHNGSLWKLHHCEGISREELEQLIDFPA